MQRINDTAGHLYKRSRHSPVFMRLDGDADNPTLWHQVRQINAEMTGHERDKIGVRLVTVSFHNSTEVLFFNESDTVEFAIPAA